MRTWVLLGWSQGRSLTSIQRTDQRGQWKLGDQLGDILIQASYPGSEDLVSISQTSNKKKRENFYNFSFIDSLKCDI